MEQNCELRSAFTSHAHINLKLLGFLGRITAPVGRERASDGWEALQVPMLPTDDSSIWQVFRREQLSLCSHLRTSATLVFDSRKCRKRLPIRSQIHCMRCLSSSTNRGLCVHETECVPFISTNLFDNGTRVDTVPNSLSHTDEEVDSELPESSQPDNRESTTLSYESTAPRFFFPCESDGSALLSVYAKMVEEKYGESKGFVGVDRSVRCLSCQNAFDGIEAAVVFRRKVTLHTLQHGSIPITVTDVQCSGCGCTNPYHGAGDSLFCRSQSSVYTRELLDEWLHDVYAIGLTFRDAFTTWMRSCGCQSATLHRIGYEPELRRQRANDAFNIFI